MRIIGSPGGDRNRKIAPCGTFSGNIATPTVQNLCATVEDCPDLPRYAEFYFSIVRTFTGSDTNIQQKTGIKNVFWFSARRTMQLHKAVPHLSARSTSNVLDDKLRDRVFAKEMQECAPCRASADAGLHFVCHSY